MAGLQIDWAFNEPEFSDSKVLLTTEQPEACRARLASIQPPSPKRANCCKDDETQQAADPEDNKPPAKTGYVAEEVHTNKLVLCGSSEFFKAAVKWGRNMGSDTDSKKRSREESQVVIVSLSSEDLFPTAKTMLRFMYTRRLEDTIDTTELLQLIKLADEYGVAHLRCACLQQLNKKPLSDWSPADTKLLYEVAAVVGRDRLAGGDLAAAATAMISNLAAGFTKLEEAWRSKEQRTTFCSLPYAVVHQVLGNDDLVVRSENTVLVVALSWLRTGGKDATQQERREVLQQVLLLQLSPWFVSWLMGYAPEAQELLLPEVVSKLVRQLASSALDRVVFLKNDTMLQRWAARRKGAAAGMTLELEASMAEQEMVDAVLKCREDGNMIVENRSQACFFDGFMWHAKVQISGRAGTPDKVGAWTGAIAELEIGGQVARGQVGILNYPANQLITVGGKIVREVVAAPGTAAFGSGLGRTVVQFGCQDDPMAVLTRSDLVRDGKVSVKVFIVQ